MFGEIIEKKFPLWHAPDIGLCMAIEADKERSDEIEVPQVGQRLERFNLPDHTTHAEQAAKVSKHGKVIQIEPEPFVAEQLSNVKEISCTAAKIENALRAH